MAVTTLAGSVAGVMEVGGGEGTWYSISLAGPESHPERNGELSTKCPALLAIPQIILTCVHRVVLLFDSVHFSPVEHKQQHKNESQD